MDFVTAISTGATVKYTCDEYVFRFVEAIAKDPHNWLGKVSHQFVGECFKALGLNFNVSIEAFEKSQDHPYRDDNLSYIFHAVPFVLKGVEEFLEQLPTLLAHYGDAVAQDTPSSAELKRFYDLIQPLPCYLRLVNIWTKVTLVITKNLHLENNVVDKFLCEPVARLSFGILKGLVKLLPSHGEKFELLRDICLRLAVIARYGILYEASYNFILKPMLNMFNEHFPLFCDAGKSALNFIYFAFCCEVANKDSYIDIYKFLEVLLDKFQSGQQRDAKGNLFLRLLTNELITDEYLAIQFELLKPHNSKPLMLATLQYLHTLQSHLVSVEVFPRRFLEQILLVLLHGPFAVNAVCSSAAKLYVTLAERQYDDQEIVTHILETFVKTQHNSRKSSTYEKFQLLLKKYLIKLMEPFPPLRSFNFYIHIIKADNVRFELSLLTAQAICALFELFTVDYAKKKLCRHRIHSFLRQWPVLIEFTAQQLQVRTVLLGIYSIVDFEAVAKCNRELLCDLELFSLNKFLDDQTLTEAEFSTLFPNLCHSIKFTGNKDKLVNAAQTLQDRYVEISLQLIHREQEVLQPDLMHKYVQYVRCLYALLKVNKLRGHQVCEMYETLAMQLLNVTVVNDNLALYGYECLAFMLILVYREREQLRYAEQHVAKAVQLAQKLYDVCVRELRSTPKNLPQAKSRFCAILVLQVGLQNDLTLNAVTYDTLLEQLFNEAMAPKARVNALSLTYVQEMHLIFRLLHQCEQIKLPNNRIWKPLLQYKTLTTTPDYVSPELEELIVVLITKRIEIYAHCLPVIHLHIGNDRKKQRVAASLAAHLQLIEEHSSARDAWLLRLHVFFAGLELLVKNQTVPRVATAPTRTRNKLLPLQHLMPLVATLRLEEFHFINIARLLYSLMINAHSAVDKQELKNFTDQISAHKYRCEDERANLLTGGELEADLKPQPPGPLALWQAEAFKYLIENGCQD